MNYSEIKRHIIGKKYFWSYSTRILIFLILGYLIYINRNSIFLAEKIISIGSISILLFFCLSTLSVYYMLMNLYRCQNFYKSYKNHLKHSTHFCKIVIEMEDYKMHVPMRSATIRPFPKSTNAVYLETDDDFLLFFSINFFGVQQVLKPFIFIKNSKEFYVKGANKNVIRDFETIETEENRAIIFSNNYGISKVIIPRAAEATPQS